MGDNGCRNVYCNGVYSERKICNGGGGHTNLNGGEGHKNCNGHGGGGRESWCWWL